MRRCSDRAPGLARHLLALVAVLVALSLSRPALADTARVAVDWERLFERGDAWLRGTPSQDLAPLKVAGPPESAPMPLRKANAAWRPRAQIVLRDWGSALKVTGEKLSMTDLVTLSRSTRMVLGRATFGDGRFVPFIQVGFGQWRVDPALSSLMPYARRMATSAGIGGEVELSSHVSAAFEVNLTTLVREGRTADDHPEAHLVTSLFALRARL